MGVMGRRVERTRREGREGGEGDRGKGIRREGEEDRESVCEEVVIPWRLVLFLFYLVCL